VTDIQYNFANNYSSLDDIKGGINQVAEAQNDVQQVFRLLNEVFDGTTADAFNAKGNEIQTKFEDLHAKMQQTTSQAVDHQGLMQNLDNKHAAQF
jgi:uncharacterized protein YukE